MGRRDEPGGDESWELATASLPLRLQLAAQDLAGGRARQLGAGSGQPDNPWAKVPMGIYAVVPDADAHYARAKAAGAEIVMELYDTPYGSREYSVRDLEGNLWSFGTYDPWAAAEKG